MAEHDKENPHPPGLEDKYKKNITDITSPTPPSAPPVLSQFSDVRCEPQASHQMLLHNLEQQLPTVCTETISVSVVGCQYIM